MKERKKKERKKKENVKNKKDTAGTVEIDRGR